jgi:glycosyltransferase involved in cell wall biosynthesis
VAETSDHQVTPATDTVPSPAIEPPAPSRRTLRVHALIDNLGFGGAEMLLPEFAARAESVGVELSVGYIGEAAVGSQALERLRRLGIEPVHVPVTSMLSVSDHRRVRRHVAEQAPDVVHTHLGWSDVLGSVAARSLGIACVSTVHEMDWLATSLRDRALMRVMALARRRCADRVVVVSDTARRAYLATGWDRPAHVDRVYNGVAGRALPGSGRAVREELGIAAGAPVVAMLSALRTEKAHDVAIEAIGRLRSAHPGLRLVIVGDGACRADIERLAEPLGDAVVLAGFRDDVMAVLDAADVLLHPSHIEAFPTALLEAMAASVPIVATAVGGIPEIVSDGVDGVLVEPPPDAGRVAEALGALLDDEERRRRLAAAGRAHFESDFTLDRWLEGTRAVYDSILAGRGA